MGRHRVAQRHGPQRDVFGISQMHISPNKGYGRFQSLFWIDGVGQMLHGQETGGLAPGRHGGPTGR